jgi:hypothetical protein
MHACSWRPISNIGFENVVVQSGWKWRSEPFVHHASQLADYGWQALIFNVWWGIQCVRTICDMFVVSDEINVIVQRFGFCVGCASRWKRADSPYCYPMEVAFSVSR